MVNHLEFGADRGDSVVFLHGGNVAGWMWGEQLPAVSNFHVLVPDLPGFGASNDEPWLSMADTSNAVADLIRTTAHGGRAHVVGLSLGSSVALELAARQPDAVSSLFLASAQVTPPRSRDLVTGRIVLALLWRQRGFWQATARGYGLTGDDADLFVDTGLGIDRATAVAVFDEVARGVPAEILARVTAPLLAVAGSKDSPAITGPSLARLRAEVPGSLTAIAEGMHHQWNIENVPLFNASLTSWLEQGRIDGGLRDTSRE